MVFGTDVSGLSIGPLKMGSIGSPETSVSNRLTPCYDREGGRTEFNRGGSLRSCNLGGSIKCGDFLDWVRSYQLVNKDSGLWNFFLFPRQFICAVCGCRLGDYPYRLTFPSTGFWPTHNFRGKHDWSLMRCFYHGTFSLRVKSVSYLVSIGVKIHAMLPHRTALSTKMYSAYSDRHFDRSRAGYNRMRYHLSQFNGC
jgi:hypothetical protein